MTNLPAITYEEELKKNPEIKESDIQLLRDWCTKQPHLPKIYDEELVLFLYSKYFSIESTKNVIDEYFTIRSQVLYNIFNRDRSEYLPAFDVMLSCPLEKTTKNGYRIIFSTLLHSDASKYVFEDYWKTLSMAIDLLLHTEGTIKGLIIVINVEFLTLGHVARFKILDVKRNIHYLQNILPCRIKGLHFINANSLMDIVLNRYMKPFMNKKLTDMLKVHSTLETLHEYIPVGSLPNEVGGKAGPILELKSTQIKNLESYRDWFLEQAKRQVDESKRPEDRKILTDLYGIEGSFRKLEID